MSEVFQAVVFEGTPEDLERWLGPLESGSVVVVLANRFAAVSPPLGQERSLDARVGAALAISVSRGSGLAVHAVLDTRIGYRHSQLFRDGEPGQTFTFAAERWHRLDDRGLPITGVTYASDEHLAGEEYETAEDAISLGLRAARFGITLGALVEAVCYAHPTREGSRTE